MLQTILQYLLVIALTLGIAYLIYFLKDKGIKGKFDYFGLAYTILNMLEKDENTSENIKNILRAISKAVDYVESNYKDEDNEAKENKALELAKSAIIALNMKSVIPEESIRSLIRISAAFMPPTNKKLE